MATATFIEKEQDFQNETTIYWFELDGTDYGTEIDLTGEEFGIVESGAEDWILAADGVPLTEGDHQTIAVRNTAAVTDEMRAA